MMEGTTTPQGAARPPTPSESTTHYRVELPNTILQKLRKTRKTLNYEDMEIVEEEKAIDTLPTDVSMVKAQEEMELEEESGVNVPTAPVLMAVKAVSVIIGELVHDSCIGCQLDCPGQKDHDDWLPWVDMVDTYFDSALARLTEARFFHFASTIYNMG